MQSFTFGTDAGMQAVVTAFRLTDSQQGGGYGYPLTLNAGDVTAVTAALRQAMGTATDAIRLQYTVNVLRAVERASGQPCELELSLLHFEALLYALRDYASTDGGPENRAWSLLSGIAATLGVEFI